MGKPPPLRPGITLSRDESPRRGFTLVEILVVTLVMALAIFPLVGYFASLTMSGEAEESDTEATTIAANIMSTLLSANVPFDAIQPAGNSDTSSLKKALTGTPQAGFTKKEFERLVSDDIQGGERIKVSKKGITYYVYVFAGVYCDRSPNTVGGTGEDVGKTFPDPESELTFSYLQGPYGDRAASWVWGFDTAQSNSNYAKVLPDSPNLIKGKDGAGFSTVPYLMKSYDIASDTVNGSLRFTQVLDRNSQWSYTSSQNYMRLPGWPLPPTGTSYIIRDTLDHRGEWGAELWKVAKRTRAPSWGYHPVTVDQAPFLPTSAKGALMKLVVGVRWNPYNYRVTSNKQGTEHEYWLVSFKARLEGL